LKGCERGLRVGEREQGIEGEEVLEEKVGKDVGGWLAIVGYLGIVGRGVGARREPRVVGREIGGVREPGVVGSEPGVVGREIGGIVGVLMVFVREPWVVVREIGGVVREPGVVGREPGVVG
jgi:hypothetical protein